MQKIEILIGITLLILLSAFLWFSFSGYQSPWIYPDEETPIYPETSIF